MSAVLDRIHQLLHYLKGHKIIRKNEDIARRVGLSPSTVSLYLRGRKPVSRRFIHALQNEFGVNLEDKGKFNEGLFMQEDVNYKDLREILQAKEAVISHQQQVITSLTEDNRRLTALTDKLLHQINEVMESIRRSNNI